MVSFSRNGPGFLGPSSFEARWKREFNVFSPRSMLYAMRFHPAFLKTAVVWLGPKNPRPSREKLSALCNYAMCKKKVSFRELDEIFVHFTKRARTRNECDIYLYMHVCEFPISYISRRSSICNQILLWLIYLI